MLHKIGVRRENKNKWERRVPLTPHHVQQLTSLHDLQIIVQPSEYRLFDEQHYISSGAQVREDLFQCDVILGVKEIPKELIEPGKTYLIFSHTIKGQSYNMDKLQRFIDQKCTLIDYECITDAAGRRLVFFGRHAGLAGMLETLYAMGKRLRAFNLDSPFNELRQAFQYKNLEEAKEHVATVGEKIRRQGLPQGILPFVAGFAGYGNVSHGAQEIFDLLPVVTVAPDDIANLPPGDGKVVYKVVFEEKDTVEPLDGPSSFTPQEYFEHPERFRSKFERYLPLLNILINGVYWDDRYPRLVSKDYVHKNAAEFRILVIGDVSCDINGSIELTGKITEPDASFYVYDPGQQDISDNPATPGIGIMAIDNLPAEFAGESSASFGDALLPYIAPLANEDFDRPFSKSELPREIKDAIIVYQGELTPNYSYLKEFLSIDAF